MNTFKLAVINLLLLVSVAGCETTSAIRQTNNISWPEEDIKSLFSNNLAQENTCKIYLDLGKEFLDSFFTLRSDGILLHKILHNDRSKSIFRYSFNYFLKNQNKNYHEIALMFNDGFMEFCMEDFNFKSQDIVLSDELNKKEKAFIEKTVKKSLKDPYSAKFKYLPKKGENFACGFVNSKNSYGGYIGDRVFATLVDSSSNFGLVYFEEEDNLTSKFCMEIANYTAREFFEYK